MFYGCKMVQYCFCCRLLDYLKQEPQMPETFSANNAIVFSVNANHTNTFL